MLVYDALYVLKTEIDEELLPFIKVFSSMMLKEILYNSEVIIKDKYYYTQFKQTHLGIFLTIISLQKQTISNGNVASYSLLKLHDIQHIKKENVEQIILVALLENKQIINSLYEEGDSYVRRNVLKH